MVPGSCVALREVVGGLRYVLPAGARRADGGRRGSVSTAGVRDLVASRPFNAWILIGDERSYPRTGLRGMIRGLRDPAPIWTASNRSRSGDLLLFYFVDPIKEVRFAARALTDAWFRSDIQVNARSEVNDHQWWVEHSPLVSIGPIPYRRLADATSGQLNLRGRTGHYVRPEVVRRVLGIPSGSLGSGVLQVPSGNPDLPVDPTTMRLGELCAIADGVLALEEEVKRYLVEPLLRLAVTERTNCRVVAEYELNRPGRRGRLKPDYAVLESDHVRSVVEVKVAIAGIRQGRSSGSRDIQQVRDYADLAGGVPAMLIDTTQILLFDPNTTEPTTVLHRLTLTQADLIRIGNHLASGPPSS